MTSVAERGDWAWVSQALIELHDFIFIGGIKKGGTWGGPACAAYVPFDTHILEASLWGAFSLVTYMLVDVAGTTTRIFSASRTIIDGVKTSSTQKYLDIIFAIVHWGIWFSILYYKINIKSLVNLLQPCHLMLLFQGVALVASGPMATYLSIVTLPLVVGAVMALMNPATEGLDMFLEKEGFFVQHTVLLITPLYLLCRYDFAATKLYSVRAVFMANWVAMAMHWLFFAHMDRHFQVNVNFFLCPSEGMEPEFKILPWYMLWPSYRTFLSNLMFVVTVPLSYLYLLAASAIQMNVAPSASASASASTEKKTT